jgi:NADH-quinone oxidoreductase subunit A
MLANYLPVLIFLAVATGLAVVLLGAGSFLGRLTSKRPQDAEKLSAYECGFEAFEDARARFDVRYYLVAILFIVFDLEMAFLVPWAVALPQIGTGGLIAAGVFLFVLTVGFAYEWKKGALEGD